MKRRQFFNIAAISTVFGAATNLIPWDPISDTTSNEQKKLEIRAYLESLVRKNIIFEVSSVKLKENIEFALNSHPYIDHCSVEFKNYDSCEIDVWTYHDKNTFTHINCVINSEPVDIS